MTPLEYLEAIKNCLLEKGVASDWLRPAATPERLARTEAVLGTTLPAEWRELYLNYDGEAGEVGLFLGLPWLPLEELVRQWRIWEDLREEYAEEGTHYSIPPGAIQELYINSGWLPLSHDWGGNHLGIDLRPGPRGKVGQFISFGRDEELKFVIAHNTEDLFRFLYEEIRSPRSVIEDGRLSWNDGDSLLSAVHHLSLPLYEEPNIPERPADDLAVWRDGLSPPWPALIQNPEEFLSRRMIHLIRRGLNDVGPLSWCRDLLGLFVAGNHIRELAPLSGLPLLRQLHAANNPISTLEGLGDLPNLGVLILDGTEVEDLSPLRALPSLSELALSRTRVTSVESFAELPNLRIVSLPKGVRDLTSLSQAPSLTTLNLQEADSSVLVGLKGLTHLSKLTLEVGQGVSLEAVANCSRLKHLSLHGAKGQDMDFLSELKELESLSLLDCELSDLHGLREHPSLKRFMSRSSTVEDLSAFTTCPNLAAVNGSYQQFLYLHDKVSPQVSFDSINDGMSREESAHWREVLEQRRSEH